MTIQEIAFIAFLALNVGVFLVLPAWLLIRDYQAQVSEQDTNPNRSQA